MRKPTLRKTLRRLRLIAAAAILIAIAATAWNPRTRQSTPSTLTAPSDSLLAVTTNPALDSRLIHYPGFTVDFNQRHHIPNWVAWELTAGETTGPAPRHNKFTADPDIPGSADPWDYNYSGYDRGHIAPAGDMKWSPEAMAATFRMTNICPQAKTLNTGPWKRLEEKCRQWARADSAIIIIAGPILTDPVIEQIGDTRVSVPRRFFKAIIAPHRNPPAAIAFILNNGANPGGLQRAAVTIDSVERATGHDLLSALPAPLQRTLQTQCDFPAWFSPR